MRYILLLMAIIYAGPVMAQTVEKNGRVSLFFSEKEVERIMKANQGFIVTGDIQDEKEVEETLSEPEEKKQVDPGPRTIALAGIVYNNPKDWTIWINGTRVSPQNVPAEIRGLIVQKDRIALRWFDKGTNRIISLVLRPLQQYNIDTDTITAGTR